MKEYTSKPRLFFFECIKDTQMKPKGFIVIPFIVATLACFLSYIKETTCSHVAVVILLYSITGLLYGYITAILRVAYEKGGT